MLRHCVNELPFCYHEKLQYAFKKGAGAAHRMRGLLCHAGRSHVGCYQVPVRMELLLSWGYSSCPITNLPQWPLQARTRLAHQPAWIQYLDPMGNFHVLIASIKKTQRSTPSYELRLARRLKWKELVKCWQMRKPGAKLSKLPSD